MVVTRVERTKEKSQCVWTSDVPKLRAVERFERTKQKSQRL